MVEEDERDTSTRQLLNLGHTVGHAVEAASDFTISHGKAVAIGMNIVASAAKRRGLLDEASLSALRALLLSYHLPITCDFSAEQLFAIAASDKKRAGRSITLVLPYGIGDTRLYPLPVSALETFIADGLSEIRGG
jgi:3-dehydroquinate synthase